MRTILIIARDLRPGVLVLAMALALGGCVTSGPEDDGFDVVATTTILGDIASNVAGPGVSVEVLMPVGVDPHDFQPSARQVAALARADLVVANGGGLEEGLSDALEAARADGVRVVEVLAEVGPLDRGGGLDPHFWLDPIRTREAAVFIAAALGDHASDGVGAYLDRLTDLDAEIDQIIAEVPQNRRKLVTNHDSLAYFADRYGLTVVGVVIPGGSTVGDPSSEDLAALVGVIERESVPAIFVEASQPAPLASAVAAEADTEVAVVELYIGSLGASGSGAANLIEMTSTNAQRIAEALAG